MFEKEAEKYVDLSGNRNYTERAFKDGAEFGFNKAKEEVEDSYRESLCNAELNLASVTEQLEELEKANEWHYVKDGLPSEDGRYLVCNIFSNNYVATNIAEFNSKNGIFGCINNSTIYAWKEIVLPKEIE